MSEGGREEGREEGDREGEIERGFGDSDWMRSIPFPGECESLLYKSLQFDDTVAVIGAAQRHVPMRVAVRPGPAFRVQFRVSLAGPAQPENVLRVATARSTSARSVGFD